MSFKKKNIIAISILLCLSFTGWWLIYLGVISNTTDEFNKMGIGIIKIINDKNQILELEIKIADEDNERSAGFQYISKEIIEKTIILFIFPYEMQGVFHMRNVEAPLDIAFIKTNGTIIEILQMTPSQTQLYSPKNSFKYAIEAREGFFKDNKISAGISKLDVTSIL